MATPSSSSSSSSSSVFNVERERKRRRLEDQTKILDWKEMYTIRHNWNSGKVITTKEQLNVHHGGHGTDQEVNHSALKVAASLLAVLCSNGLSMSIFEDGQRLVTLEFSARVTSFGFFTGPTGRKEGPPPREEDHHEQKRHLACGLNNGSFQVWVASSTASSEEHEGNARLLCDNGALVVEEDERTAVSAIHLNGTILVVLHQSSRLCVWSLDHHGKTLKLHSLLGISCGSPSSLHLRRVKHSSDAQQRGIKDAKWKLVICFTTPTQAPTTTTTTTTTTTAAEETTRSPLAAAPAAQCICYQDMDFTRTELVTGNFITGTLSPNGNDYHVRFGLMGPHSHVNCIQFEPFSKILVSGHSDNTIRVWRAFQRKHHYVPRTTAYLYSTLSLSALASAANSERSDWTFHHEKTLHGHTGAVTCLRFDDFKLVSGSNDRTVKIWSMETGECQTTLSGHAAPLTSLGFDDHTIFSLDKAGTLKTWSFKTTFTTE
jgi:WD40 repeat protein